MFPDIIAALIDDSRLWRHPTALRVYRHLYKTYPHIYHQPEDIKAWLVAENVGTNRQRVQKAIELLVTQGWAIECGRGDNGVRRLMLARERVT